MDSFPPSATVDSSDAHLLIVDFDLSAGAYGSSLRSMYRVTTASGVAAARRLMQQLPLDLIITEMKFDDGSGVEICRAAKALAVPASVLVTTSAPENAPEAILAGCDGVLLKPFAPNLLYARIGRMMRLRDKSRTLRDRSTSLLKRVEAERSKLQHLVDRRDRHFERTILDWPNTHCPYCGHQGATSFDYANRRRSWYACLACRKVWLAKRQE